MSSVYFIQCSMTQAVKIGISAKPWGRMRKMQSDTPGDLTMLALIEGGRPEEVALHARFADDHIRGEWFRASPALMAYVATLPCPPRPRKVRTPQNSPGKLAEAVGIAPGYACAFLKGSRTPNFPMAVRIYEATGLKLGILSGRSDTDTATLCEISAKMRKAA